MRSARGAVRSVPLGPFGLAVEQAHRAPPDASRAAAGCRPLPRGFVEQHAGGDRGVQALHRAGAGNGDRAVGLAARSSGTPLPSLPMRSATGRPGPPDRRARRRARRWSRSSRRPRAAASKHSPRSPQAAARGRRCPPRRARPLGFHALTVPGRLMTPSRQRPRRSAESCPGCLGPASRPAPRSSGAVLPLAAKHVRPGPIRRLDQRGNRLRRFGRQRGVEQLPRQPQHLGFRRQAQRLQQALGALRHKDALDAQAGAQRLFEQVRPLDAGQAAPRSRRAAVASARRSSFRRAFCLLCTMRTGIGRETSWCCADSMPFAAAAGSEATGSNLHRGWCCDSFRLCSVFNSGTEVGLLVRGDFARPSR